MGKKGIERYESGGNGLDRELELRGMKTIYLLGSRCHGKHHESTNVGL